MKNSFLNAALKPLLSASFVATISAMAASADTAVVLRNADYAQLPDIDGLPRGTQTRLQGYTVVNETDADQRGFGDFIGKLAGAIEDPGPLVTMLSGHMVHSATDSYLLSTDAPKEVSPAALPGHALPLSMVLGLMAHKSGAALLLISVPEDEVETSALLEPGLGDISIPQGVTVVSGSARDISALATEITGQSNKTFRELLARRDLTVAGYQPEDVSAFGNTRHASTTPSRSEPTRAAAGAELWRSVRERDTLEAYQLYLDTYPDGEHATEAQTAADEIRTEPGRAARLAEEGLNLSGDSRREIQRDLKLLGFNTRGIDGIFGPGTRSAIGSWQSQNGFEETSYLTSEQINRIDAQAARRSAELEEEARRRQEEQARADRAFWEETGRAGDAPGLRAYIKRFPDGQFADVANERLQVIEQRARAEAQADERANWDAAASTNTVDAYSEYLAAYPRGQFAEPARARIEQLTAAAGNQQAQARARAEEQQIVAAQPLRLIVEERLRAMGLEPGPVDGNFDDNTRRALRRYQDTRGLTVTGFIDQSTAVRLLADNILQ